MVKSRPKVAGETVSFNSCLKVGQVSCISALENSACDRSIFKISSKSRKRIEFSFVGWEGFSAGCGNEPQLLHGANYLQNLILRLHFVFRAYMNSALSSNSVDLRLH